MCFQFVKAEDTHGVDTTPVGLKLKRALSMTMVDMIVVSGVNPALRHNVTTCGNHCLAGFWVGESWPIR